MYVQLSVFFSAPLSVSLARTSTLQVCYITPHMLGSTVGGVGEASSLESAENCMAILASSLELSVKFKQDRH